MSTIDWFRDAMGANASTGTGTNTGAPQTATQPSAEQVPGIQPNSQPTAQSEPSAQIVQPALPTCAAASVPSSPTPGRTAANASTSARAHDPRWARAIRLAEACSITPATPPRTPGAPRYPSLDDLVAVCKFLRNLGCKIESTPAPQGGVPGLKIVKPAQLTDPNEWEALDPDGKRVGGIVVDMLPPFRDQLAEVLGRMAAEERPKTGRR